MPGDDSDCVIFETFDRNEDHIISNGPFAIGAPFIAMSHVCVGDPRDSSYGRLANRPD